MGGLAAPWGGWQHRGGAGSTMGEAGSTMGGLAAPWGGWQHRGGAGSTVGGQGPLDGTDNLPTNINSTNKYLRLCHVHPGMRVCTLVLHACARVTPAWYHSCIVPLPFPFLSFPCLALPCLALPCLPCLLLWSSSQLHPSCSLCSTIPDYPDSSGCLACFVDGCSVNREAGHERGARAARIRPALGACGNVRWPVFVYGRQNLERICWVRAAYIQLALATRE